MAKSAQKRSAKKTSPARRPVPTLSARIARIEAVVFPKAVTIAAAPAPAARFIKLDAKGNPTTGKHVAVRDNVTGLEWSAEPLNGGNDLNHADAVKACAGLDLCGHRDWRLPTHDDLRSIVDLARVSPAVDPDLFAGPYGWTWSSTPYAGNPSGAAWCVNLSFGLSHWWYHNDQLHVRAVRAGQSSRTSA